MAKSYFNSFIENLLTKSYVKKPHHFNSYQNSLMDDLTYASTKKTRIQLYLCKMKCLPTIDQNNPITIGWNTIYLVIIVALLFLIPYKFSFKLT